MVTCEGRDGSCVRFTGSLLCYTCGRMGCILSNDNFGLMTGVQNASNIGPGHRCNI